VEALKGMKTVEGKSGGVASFAEGATLDLVKQERLTEGARGFPVAVALGLASLWRGFFSKAPDGEPIGYKFLNLGFKVCPSGGTDCYMNNNLYGAPPGSYSAYVKAGKLAWDSLLKAMNDMNEHKIFVTSGPLLLLTCNGRDVGSTVMLPAPWEVSVRVEAYHIFGLDKVELVMNGEVVRSFECKGRKSLKEEFSLPIKRTCWPVARTNGVRNPFIGEFAHTAPIYIQVGDEPIRPKEEDIAFFLEWLDSLKRTVLKVARKQKLPMEQAENYCRHIDRAREVFESLRRKPRTWLGPR